MRASKAVAKAGDTVVIRMGDHDYIGWVHTFERYIDRAGAKPEFGTQFKTYDGVLRYWKSWLDGGELLSINGEEVVYD